MFFFSVWDQWIVSENKTTQENTHTCCFSPGNDTGIETGQNFLSGKNIQSQRRAQKNATLLRYTVLHTAVLPGRRAERGRAACSGGGRTPSRRRLLSPCPERRGWRAAGRDEAAGREAANLSCSPRGWGQKQHRGVRVVSSTSDNQQRIIGMYVGCTQVSVTLVPPHQLSLGPCRPGGWWTALELDRPLLAGLGTETYKYNKTHKQIHSSTPER